MKLLDAVDHAIKLHHESRFQRSEVLEESARKLAGSLDTFLPDGYDWGTFYAGPQVPQGCIVFEIVCGPATMTMNSHTPLLFNGCIKDMQTETHYDDLCPYDENDVAGWASIVIAALNEMPARKAIRDKKARCIDIAKQILGAYADNGRIEELANSMMNLSESTWKGIELLSDQLTEQDQRSALKDKRSVIDRIDDTLAGLNTLDCIDKAMAGLNL